MDLHGLPTKPEDLVEALQSGLKASRSVRNLEAVVWDVTRYWLRGIREFDMVDGLTGTVVASWSDPTQMVVYEEALGAVQEEIGKLLRVDLRPAVEAIGIGLDSTRKSAIGHACLTSLAGRMSYDDAKRSYITMLVHYGTVGLLLDETIRRDREWRPRFEVVPPWELLGLPAESPGPLHTKAIARERWVPFEWLLALQKDGSDLIRPRIKVPSSIDDWDVRKVPFGGSLSITGELKSGNQFQSSLAGVGAVGTTVGQPSGMGMTGDPKKTDSSGVPHVRMTEIWFTCDGENVDRYVVMLGDKHIAVDINYWAQGIQRPLPLGVGRYVEVGSFYGRSFAYPRVELNQITERLLETVIKNVEDFDQYGILMTPRNSGVRRMDLLRSRDGAPRVASFEPDPFAPNIQPFAIQPVTTGDMPGKVLGMIEGLTNRVLPQYSMFADESPQRADSATALQAIDQAANEPRSAPSGSMGSCWINVYRALLEGARRQYGTEGVIPLVMLDDSMVGVVFDNQKGGLSLDQNSIPNAHEVKISVRSRSPKNEAAVAQWLNEALKMGIVTPRQFRIEVRKNGLEGMPVANEAEWNAYQKVMLNIVQVFNDGKSPGDYTISPEGDLLEIHYEYVKAFMASPRYALASKEVRNQFLKMMGDIESLMGRFPSGLPSIEDAAMMQQQQMDAMGGQGGMPGMMGGPPGGMPPGPPMR